MLCLSLTPSLPNSCLVNLLNVFLPLPIFWITFGPLLDTFGKKQAKGHVSLLPGLVLLVALAVHSALACHTLVLRISKCHIKLSLEMPEKITFSEIKVQSYVFYF